MVWAQNSAPKHLASDAVRWPCAAMTATHVAVAIAATASPQIITAPTNCVATRASNCQTARAKSCVVNALGRDRASRVGSALGPNQIVLGNTNSVKNTPVHRSYVSTGKRRNTTLTIISFWQPMRLRLRPNRSLTITFEIVKVRNESHTCPSRS